MQKNKKLVIGYCRCSTEEQKNEGLSLDVQEQACKDTIKADGHEKFEIIRDEGKSGGSLKRAGIEKIIRMAINQEISAVYTISSDRLNRNTGDYLYLRELFRKNDVELKYIYGQTPDDSAMSRTMDTVMASFNEMQRLVISEKVKKTLDAKAQAGYFPGQAPVGYKNIDNPDTGSVRFAKKIIVPDPERAPYVTEAFRMYATGNYSGYDLNDIFYEKGLRTKTGSKLSQNRFYELLKNPTYTGAIVWGNINLENGRHTPLIDKATFVAVQSILDSHNQHACRRRKYFWLLNGFLYCAKHKRRYTAEWHLKKKLAYYHCSFPHGCGKYIESTKLEISIGEKFQDLQFDEGFTEKVIEEVRAIFLQRRKEYEVRRQSFVNKKTALEYRRKSAEDKLFSGTILDEDFSRIRDGIKAELYVIENALAELENKHDIKVDVAQEVLRFTKNIYAAFKQASPALKKHYLNFFWESFELADGIIIRTTPTLLFRELLQLQQVYFTDKNSLKIKDLGISQDVILNGNLGA